MGGMLGTGQSKHFVRARTGVSIVKCWVFVLGEGKKRGGGALHTFGGMFGTGHFDLPSIAFRHEWEFLEAGARGRGI